MRELIARTYDSGFPGAKDTYNGILSASNGNIYYVLSSQAVDIGAQLYCYDPARDAITYRGDLTEACGEKDSRTIVHGPIFFDNGDRPSYVNSIAVAKDGTVYAISRVNDEGRPDPISFHPETAA
jgi:hypothetical protein